MSAVDLASRYPSNSTTQPSQTLPLSHLKPHYSSLKLHWLGLVNKLLSRKFISAFVRSEPTWDSRRSHNTILYQSNSCGNNSRSSNGRQHSQKPYSNRNPSHHQSTLQNSNSDSRNPTTSKPHHPTITETDLITPNKNIRTQR